MDNTRFVLVRHGQTAWNREVRFRGREDLPLDETGVRQAQAAAQTIAQRYRPAALYSSPLTPHPPNCRTNQRGNGPLCAD